MPSTDRRLELKAKDIDGSDRLTAGCVCQWVKNRVFKRWCGAKRDAGIREQ